MELLMKFLPCIIAFAEEPAKSTAVTSDFFGVLAAGANIFVQIIRFSALLFVLVKIAALGFKISTTAKSSADAIKLVKDEGLALFIGLMVVLTAFMIHGAMKDTAKVINDNKGDKGTINYTESDVFE